MTKEQMRNKLITADKKYYNKDNPIMADHEYDDLFNKFKILYPDDPYIKNRGMTLPETTEWKKAKHIIKMSSLDKVNNKEEFIKWANNKGVIEVLIEDKLDGISIELIYNKGKLTQAITRGDGIIGEDIFSNVCKMQGVKTSLPNNIKIDASLRAEIFMLQSDFENVNEILIAEDEKPHANPRNSAGGIAKRFDGRFSEYLTLLYYNIESKDLDFTFATEKDKMDYIGKDGLNLQPCFYKLASMTKAIEIFDDYVDNKRAKTPYDIDGLVIKANSIRLQNELGYSASDLPNGQIAWKFPPMQKETTIEGVEFSMGKNRRISPVALLAPVNLGGVTIKRASLHNFDIFKSFNLGKGDIVLISRRNDVIPGIEKVIKHNGKKFEIPTKCPICNSVLELGDKFLICPNDECQGLYIGNLYKWITNLEIMDIGERIIELLYNNNKIKEPADFYKLKVTDFMNIEGMGQKSGQKIIDHLQEKTNITLSDFIGGLNMNNFSNSIAENLMNNGIDTLEKMQKATINDLIKIKGIETKTAEKIITGLKTKEKVINNLLKYITIKVKEKVMSKSKVLSGKSFVFTGGVKRIDDNGDRWTRDMLSDLVIENGGEVQSSVNKNTTYLVQADPSSQSTKTKKAISLGVTILGEDNFFDMMNM